MEMFWLFSLKDAMVCISTASSLKLQGEHVRFYVHFVFIDKSPCHIL